MQDRGAPRQHRVLVVDDFALWRAEVRAILAASQGWEIVGEACDGPEAVQNLTDLRPDIVLRDIGLPTLNGIEVARTIRKICPEIRVVFLSQNEDQDIVDAAVSLGRTRYVSKANAARRLVSAMIGALDDC